MAVDSLANIYVLGYNDTVTIQFFAHQSVGYFLAKYSPSGALLSTTFFDNRTAYKKGSCAVALDQSVFVSLAYQDSLVLPTGTLHTHNALNYAFALIRLNASGNEANHLDFAGKKPWISDISCPSKLVNYNAIGSELKTGVVFVGTCDSLVIDNVYVNQYGISGSTGYSAIYGAYKNLYYCRLCQMMRPLNMRPTYIEPTSVSCDTSGHDVITGKFIGDGVLIGAYQSGVDTMHSISTVGDTDLFYALDTIGAGLIFLKVIQSPGNDAGAAVAMIGDTTALVSGQLASGGISLAGNTMRAGNFLMAFPNIFRWTNYNAGGTPIWTIQQPPGYSCNINALAKSQSIFFGGNTLNGAIFNQNQVFGALGNGGDRGFVGKLDGINCTLTTAINGTGIDTILSCGNPAAVWALGNGGTGNYAYHWTNGSYMTDSMQPTVLINKAVNRKKFIVTVTDLSTGCIAKDSVIVGVYLAHNDTLLSCHGAAVTLDAGPGSTMLGSPYYVWSPGQNSESITVTQPGHYTVQTNFPTCGIWNSDFYVIDSCINPCHLSDIINSGADTILSCQQTAVLVASTTGGSGRYGYTWNPSNILVGNGPTVLVNQQVDMQKLVVSIYDSITGCSLKDSVVVGVYLAHFDTLNICNHQPITLDMGAGASRYEWNGNFADSVQLHVADTAGQYFGIAFYYRPYANCGALTSLFVVRDSCTTVPDLVWPGDANSNGVADLYDVLNIGIGYGNTGPVRTNRSTVWVGQPASDWQLQFLNGVNLKHADCDGNGIIDSVDVDVVAQNYGLTHAKVDEAQQNPLNPDLYVQFTIDSATNHNLVTANVFLGRSAHPVSNGYGLAYSLFYDPTIVDTNVTASYAGSWLGQNDVPVHLVKNIHTNGRIDLAYSRTNHTNVNGYGQVAAISLYIQDNIIGKDQDLFKLLSLQISGAKLVDKDGVELDINVQNDTMVVYQGVNNLNNGSMKVDVYPNPGDGKFNLVLTGNDAIRKVTLMNTIGQSLVTKQYEQPAANRYQFDSGLQAAGMYFLKIETNSQVVIQRVVIK